MKRLIFSMIALLLTVSCASTVTRAAFDVVTFELSFDGHSEEVRAFCSTTMEPDYIKVATYPPGTKVAVFNKSMNDGDTIQCNMIAYKGDKKSVPSNTVSYTHSQEILSPQNGKIRKLKAVRSTQ